jgi:hypothetical protein
VQVLVRDNNVDQALRLGFHLAQAVGVALPWSWPNSVLLFLSATTPLCTATAECRWPRKRIQAPQRSPHPNAAIICCVGPQDLMCLKNSVISASFGPEIVKTCK